MRSGKPTEILRVMGDALKEWKTTPSSSTLYPARAFCIHELVPSWLPPGGGPDASPSTWRQPTSFVMKFEELGIEYFYYSPDGAWNLRKDPVDLHQLATEYLSSRWGREAFLMMTRLGWSHGACQEGPDQFRQVIKHGEAFLTQYHDSEVSDKIRLEMANAYATWWNVANMEPDAYTNPESYKAGSLKAKQRAVELYKDYLRAHKEANKEVPKRLKALEENPKGSETYDYLCEDYED